MDFPSDENLDSDWTQPDLTDEGSPLASLAPQSPYSLQVNEDLQPSVEVNVPVRHEVSDSSSAYQTRHRPRLLQPPAQKQASALKQAYIHDDFESASLPHGAQASTPAVSTRARYFSDPVCRTPSLDCCRSSLT
eukprot:3094873-Rhodomonas_salina.4